MVQDPKSRSRQCQKCGYARTPQDRTPDYACPKCHSVYAKWDAVVAERRQAHAAQQARRDGEDRRTMAHVGYALLVIPAGGLTHLAGIILAYVMRSQARGTWLESHFRRQVGTYWLGFFAFCLWIAFWGAIGFSVLSGPGQHGQSGGRMLLPGPVVLVLVVAYLWRVASGWAALCSGKAT